MGEQANDPTYIGFSCIADQYQRKVRIAKLLNKSTMCPERKSQIGWFSKRFVLCSSLSYSCQGFT